MNGIPTTIDPIAALIKAFAAFGEIEVGNYPPTNQPQSHRRGYVTFCSPAPHRWQNWAMATINEIGGSIVDVKSSPPWEKGMGESSRTKAA